jgi:hypothetical protein
VNPGRNTLSFTRWPLTLLLSKPRACLKVHHYSGRLPWPHQVNIVGLETRLVGEPDGVYVMHFELEVPAGRAAQVQSDLAAAGRALGVEVSMRPDEPDVL